MLSQCNPKQKVPTCLNLNLSVGLRLNSIPKNYLHCHCQVALLTTKLSSEMIFLCRIQLIYFINLLYAKESLHLSHN